MQVTRLGWNRKLWLLLPLILAACGRVGDVPSAAPAPLLATGTPRPTPSLARPDLAAVGDPGLATALPTPAVTAAPSAPAVVDGIGDPYLPALGNLGYDVAQYTLRFRLDPAQEAIEAHATLVIESREQGLRRLSLDFIGFTVRELSVDGTPALFTRDGAKLRIELPQPEPLGATFSIDIHYGGSPEPYVSPYLGAAALGLRFSGPDRAFAFSEPDGARAWFPANDHPRDKATFRIELDVPEGLTGVANGRLEGRERLGAWERFVWQHDAPMATYLAVIAMGPYERVESVADNGTPLRHYLLPGTRAEFDSYAGVNEEALAWMAERLGPYPFAEYGYVVVDLPGVSLETQTMVLLSSSMIGARTMIHEMVHMWFGNWVSLDSWAEMWRNEGFATYFQLLWEYRDDPDGLEAELAGIASAVEEDARDYPLGSPPPSELFGFETYFKGALLAHALRVEMGDRAYFAGLQEYFKRYGGGTASQEQFATVMEEAAGRPLGDFFAGWLE